jgi:hypothetical protein
MAISTVKPENQPNVTPYTVAVGGFGYKAYQLFPLDMLVRVKILVTHGRNI